MKTNGDVLDIWLGEKKQMPTGLAAERYDGKQRRSVAR